jgi:hypothetical protein
LSDTPDAAFDVNSAVVGDHPEFIASACAWKLPLKILYDANKADLMQQVADVLRDEYALDASQYRCTLNDEGNNT